ncbi:MAG TPA: hypothetical protein VLX92_05700 [Kofleriaceae bacterium]|nr:hypothetical protein [Kofleriaceae bacterium]
MIPYDDLVAALSAWRARQGLPVSALGGPRARLTPPPMPVAVPRTAPPMAPPGRSKTPPPLEPVEELPDAAELLAEADAMLDENAYENEGADYAMTFGQSQDDSQTALAPDPAYESDEPPQRDSLSTDPVGAPPTRRKRDEW